MEHTCENHPTVPGYVYAEWRTMWRDEDGQHIATNEAWLCHDCFADLMVEVGTGETVLDTIREMAGA